MLAHNLTADLRCISLSTFSPSTVTSSAFGRGCNLKTCCGCAHSLWKNRSIWTPLAEEKSSKKMFPAPIGFERSLALAKNISFKKTLQSTASMIPSRSRFNANKLASQKQLETKSESDRGNTRKREALYNTRYKTQMCMHYKRNRICPAGKDCHYAHGEDELRRAEDHPKFRTKACRHFAETGRCPFGDECYFLHHTCTSSGSIMGLLRCEACKYIDDHNTLARPTY